MSQAATAEAADMGAIFATVIRIAFTEAPGELKRVAMTAHGLAIEAAWSRASTWGSYAALGLLGTFGGLWFLILPTIGASLACAHYGRKARDMRLVWRTPQVSPS